MIADDGYIAVVADDRSFTMIADYDFAIAAAWVNRAHHWRNLAGSASLCKWIDDFAGRVVVTDDRRRAMIANNR